MPIPRIIPCCQDDIRLTEDEESLEKTEAELKEREVAQQLSEEQQNDKIEKLLG